ncbi:skin secretory protein xP2-like [Setaria italica]|uniref:skin secretory protein xP2-like n=1 Tax=Setaria italica TaxID=4555 RepID=UPI0003513C46|nr:skin secretory protein xP2-like [Setaria italica]
MVPGAPTKGTILATGALADSEIWQQVREVLDDKDADYPVPGHPPMHPDENFIELCRPSGLRPAAGAEEGATGVVRLREASRDPAGGERRCRRGDCGTHRRGGLYGGNQREGVAAEHEQGPTPAPPSASAAAPAKQGVAAGVPLPGEVIDLDDKAEEEPAAPTAIAEMGAVAPVTAMEMEVVTEEGKSTPASMTGIAAAVEAGVRAPAAATKAATAAKAGVPAPAATTEVGTPASAAATKAAAAVGTGMPAPTAVTETMAVADGAGCASASTVAAATSTETAAHVPGPSARPAA